MSRGVVVDAYCLPRNESERQRLDIQYAYLKRLVTDGRLIFDKQVEITPGSWLLDSATGTGIWALEAAEYFPESVNIHAVDLSGNNFPSSPPSNAHFSVESVTNLPGQWSEEFDFVNQRMLFGALLREQWPEALSEIFRVLKPGGAVQLIELDLYHPVPETAVVMHYRDTHETSMENAGFIAHVARKLPDMLLEAGFVGVKSEVKHTPMGKKWGEIGMQGAVCFGGALRQLSSMFMKAGKANSKEEYEELMDKLVQEWDENGTQYHGIVTFARKPFV